jgi:hypothetical protein
VTYFRPADIWTLKGFRMKSTEEEERMCIADEVHCINGDHEINKENILNFAQV